jgi:predicted Zn-dependent peptidase
LIAETKALLAENAALTSRLDELVEEARQMLARATKQDPAHLDIDKFLRDSFPPEELARIRAQAQSEMEMQAAQAAHAAAASSQPTSTAPAARRPHRRMV